MKPKVTLRQALDDDALLGQSLPGPTWLPWRTLLIAAMGEPLFNDERPIFTKLTKRAREPLQRVSEMADVVGRRGGKTRALSTVASYTAGLCDFSDSLARGEQGVFLCVAQDTRTAQKVLDFCESDFQNSPILKPLMIKRTSDSISLANNISIDVRASNYRRIRGITFIGAIVDELAFFHDDSGGSLNPDSEIVNAIRPGLMTTHGSLYMASSPYAQRGELWKVFKRHFGPDGSPRILVAQGSTRDLNSTIPQTEIDEALARDYARNVAELLAQFRTDVEGYITVEVVEGCVAEFYELPPSNKFVYSAFVDPSGGRSDSFTMAIAHRDGDKVVVDCIREACPPLSPEAVVKDLALTLKAYRVHRVKGDKYAGEFCTELFRKANIRYEASAAPKSDLYRDLLPLLNSGLVVLPRNDRLVSQLAGLERQTSRAGKDSIDHMPGAHDDVANAVAGAVSATKRSYDPTYGEGFTNDEPPPRPRSTGEAARDVHMSKIDHEWQRARLMAHIWRQIG